MRSIQAMLMLGLLSSNVCSEELFQIPLESKPTSCEQCEPEDPFANVPVTRIFPRSGVFAIPPSGRGFYSALDMIRGEAREKRRASPFIPFALTPYSMFDLDYRFLDKKDFNDPFPTDFLRRIRIGDNWMFSTGGQAWTRFMSEDNSRLSGRNNHYYLSRARTYGDLWYKDRIRFFAEFITAHYIDGELAPLPIDENRADLLNAFIDVKIAKIKDHPVYARVGRQELLLGSQRLISPLDWGNTRRTFEGIRVFRQGKKFDVDAFWLRPVVVDRDDFDESDENRDFIGLFTTYRPKKGTFADLYYLFLNEDAPRPNPTEVHTLGARFAGDQDGKWLWDVEGDLQFGNRNGQDIFAGAVSVGAGYHNKCLPFNPTFWINYDYASGDDNPNDGDFNTFNQLFPFGHFYLGWIDLVGRQNIHDVNAHLYLFPAKWITLWFQYHHFTLDSATDALFNAGGVAIRRDATGASGRDVGQEFDIVANFHLARNTDLLVGYSHLFSGSFINRTAGNAAAGQDASLFYAMFSVRW